MKIRLSAILKFLPLVILFGDGFFIGCSSPQGDISFHYRSTIPASATETVHTEKGELQKPETILVREWTFRDGREYSDRNGDGIVDWEARDWEGEDLEVDGQSRYSDGLGIYREDNDYDGFYDREYVCGGFDGRIIYDKPIYKPIPEIHRVYPPNKVTKKPKAK